MVKFIGRKQPLADLNRFLTKKSSSIIVVTGRRRVGKSRLIQEFAKGHNFLKFSGLPPTTDTTAQSQRDTFSTQLAQQTDLPAIKPTDWAEIFALLAMKTQNGRMILLLDEISWMGSEDETFLGKLKIAWDEVLSHNPKLILVLCGSVSTWIKKNIISSTGYFGRISKQLELEPFMLSEANEMLMNVGFKRSSYEKFRILSVTGTIPWYLEHVQGNIDADTNIRELCFRKGSLLVEEFDRIFHDLFSKRGDWYQTIVKTLVSGPKNFEVLCRDVGYASSGTMSGYLDELIQAGFLKRSYTWSLSTGKKSNLTVYRLSDNYLRFYLKYIEPKMDKIDEDIYVDTQVTHMPGWESIMGLQFENLVLNNAREIFKQLNIPVDTIVQSGSFIQRKTSRQQGVQIDYMIQTKFNTLFVCEIKFSRAPLSKSVIKEVQHKIKSISKPREFVCIPILIHVNGVDEGVVEEGYFMKIIDFASLM